MQGPVQDPVHACFVTFHRYKLKYAGVAERCTQSSAQVAGVQPWRNCSYLMLHLSAVDKDKFTFADIFSVRLHSHIHNCSQARSTV